MKTVILCGGRGTRLGEHGTSVPKALFPIGGKPIIWHLLKIYSAYGIKDFILCLGYLGDEIKRYFIEQSWLSEDFTLNGTERITLSSHHNEQQDWKITFAETGLDTNTGGRLKKIEKYLDGEDDFCITYGDGLSNVDIRSLIEYHKAHGKIATLTAVNPYSSFGLLKIDEDNTITAFMEKPRLQDWINGGFFVFNRRIFDYLDENCILEREPFERLASEKQLVAFRHTDFWKCMDTYKDNIEFNQLWESGKPDWKIW